MEDASGPPDVLAGPLGGRQLVVPRLPVDDVQGDLFQTGHGRLALKSSCRHDDVRVLKLRYLEGRYVPDHLESVENTDRPKSLDLGQRGEEEGDDLVARTQVAKPQHLQGGRRYKERISGAPVGSDRRGSSSCCYCCPRAGTGPPRPPPGRTTCTPRCRQGLACTCWQTDGG